MPRKTTTTTTTTTTVISTSHGPQHDYILLDRSGSMATRWSDSLGGVNAYVHGLAKDVLTRDIFVTVAVFDSGNPFEVLRKNIKASEWKDISAAEVYPRGYTPLFDAIGRLVTVAMSDLPEKSAIVIMTDGHENQSREHNKDSARKLLNQCREKGWQVLFLGADFENATQANDLGNFREQTMSYNSINSQYAMTATAATRAVYSSGVGGMSFSDDVRTRSAAPRTESQSVSPKTDPSSVPSSQSGT